MDFPPEIFRQILNQCALPELKKCLEVSDDFREMIITTPRLMRKMPVIFFRCEWNDTVPFVEKNGKHVRSIKFQDCSIDNTNDVRRILNFTPNLEELDFNSFGEDAIAGEVTTTSNDIELNLTAIKSLKIGAPGRLTKDLVHDLRNSTNIIKFSIDTSFELPVSEVGDFLAQQMNLKELSLNGNLSDDFAIRTIFSEKFVNNESLKLKTLVLHTGLEYNRALSDFLKAQSKNIEVLEILNYEINFHFYRIVFKNFHNLKKFSGRINYNFNEARCAELAEYSLPNLTEFGTDERVDDALVFAALIKMFPNLEVIRTPISDFPLHGILEYLPKLRRIETASCFKLEMMMFAKSFSLRELEVSTSESMMQSFLWKTLAEDFPNIEKIVIKNVTMKRLARTIHAEVEMVLKNLKNFKRLDYFEIVNNIESFPQFSVDNDSTTDQSIPDIICKHNFLLKKKLDETFYLKFSRYFNQHQAESVDQIKRDFRVSEVVEKG